MKGMYWNSSPKSTWHYLVLVTASIFGFYLVETCKLETIAEDRSLKMEASSIALNAFEEIRKTKSSAGKIPDLQFDPSGSGLIGEFFTPVTSNMGVLGAKQTSINPNFAGLVVQYLHAAGVKKGDRIAVGMSGSFPALNIAVYAAARVLELKLVVVSSLSSSQWGANDPDFLWPDMERILFEKEVFPYRSVALSVGGIEDRGLGISKEGLELLTNGALRNHLPLIRQNSSLASLEERIRLYQTIEPISNYKAYINVGGGTVSVGTKLGSREFQPGLNLKRISGIPFQDSVMSRFYSQNIPVIHLVRIQELATENGFSLRPEKMPELGEGKIYGRMEYNPILTAIVLVLLLALLYVLFRTGSLVTEDADSTL